MGIFEAIKKGFVVTTKLLTVVLIFFVFNAIIGLVSLPLAAPAGTANPATIALSVALSLASFLIFIFLQGGALGIVRDQIKTASSNIGQFVEYGKKFYLRILLLLLLYIAVAVGVVLILSLASAGILLLGDNIVTRIIVAAIVTVSAVVIITLLIYPIYALIVEDLGPMAALKKGFNTSKANFLATLGLFIVMLLISLAISLIVGFLVGLVSVPLPANIGQVVIAIVNALVQSYIPVIMMVAFMAFYLSLRSKGSQS